MSVLDPLLIVPGLSDPLDQVVSSGVTTMVGVDDAGPEDQQQHSEEESSDKEMVRALFQHLVKRFSLSWLAIMLFCMGFFVSWLAIMLFCM